MSYMKGNNGFNTVSLSILLSSIGMSRSTVNRWIAKDKFPYIRIGRRRRLFFSVHAVNEWFDRHQKVNK